MAGNPPAMRGDGLNLGVQGNPPQQNPKHLLPTFIYDYFIKKRELDLAQQILNSTLNVQTVDHKPGQMNGPDDDSKDDLQRKLDALPRPATQDQTPDSPFLDDWWSVFWDMWSASRDRGKGPKTGPAAQYLQINQRGRQLQQQQQQQMLNAGMMGVQPGMNGMASAQFNMMRNGGNPNMANGAMGNDGLRRAALQRQVTPPPLTHELPDNTMNRPGMQPGRMNQPGQPREGELAGDGQRAPSPMSGDTAPSPKRQRIGEGPPGMSNPPMARPGMPGQMPNGAMMPGMKPNPGMGTPGQMPQGSPVMTGPEGQMAMPGDMFPNGAGQMQRGMGGTNNNQQGGALADYQMQLMLLEQQNKKRLLMARQEQEVVNNGNGQQGGATGQGMMGQGHFGGNPTSPMPGGGDMQRNSPAPGFDANMQMHNPMFMKPMAEGGMPPMMRPPGIPGFSQPSPQQLEMMRRNGAPMPGGQAWPQGAPMPGPMGPGGPQGTPGPGDNGQRGQMPPPSAPAGNNAGRTQPSSPSQTQNTAPPTPQQGNKANPKKGKNAGKKDDKVSFGAARMEEMEELTFTKKAPKKGSNATGTTSAKAGGNAPSSPPPAPPITPQNRDSFSFPQGQPNPGSGPGGQAPGPAASTGSEGPPDANAQAPFGNIDQSGGNDPMDNLFNTPYGGEGGVSTDVLDGFDFESFLHMDGTESMDPQFPFDQPFMHDSMEMPGQS